MSKQILKNYTFVAASRTITLTDLTTVRLDRLQLITDVTTNVILYNFADATVSTATVATNVITLSAVGTAASTDKLQIIYDVLSTDPTAATDPQLGAATVTPDTILQNAVAVTGVGANLTVTGYGTALVQLTGTFVASVVFEASSNAGVTWDSISATKIGTSIIASTATLPGQYRLTVTGFDLLRANTTWTSGTSLTATGRATNAVNSSKVIVLAPSVNPIGKVAVDQTTNIIAGTVMQTAAVAVGNGVNLNVQGYVSAIISVTGTMGANTAITFEASVDDTTFVPITAHQIGLSGNLAPTTTNIGDFRFSCAAYKSIRARISVFGTGSVNAKGYVSALAGHPTTVNANLIAALPAGTNAIGGVGGDSAAATANSGSPVKIGGVYNSSPPVYTTGQRGDVQIDSRGSLVTQLVSNGVYITGLDDNTDALATTGFASRFGVMSRGTVYNGTTWDRARGDTTAGAWVQVKAALPAGANTIGNVNVVGTVPVSLATAPTTPVTGTFFQATQPVSLATNTPVIATGTNTIGSVKLTDGSQILTPTGENNTFADTKIGLPVLARTVGSGATAIAKPLLVDASGNLLTAVNAALPTGANTIGNVGITGTVPVSLATNTPILGASTNVIGKVGIDQTTPGTTNAVAVTNTSLTVAQATAANLNATVSLAAAQTLSTVTTVGAVTAITNALPTGANTIGAVNIAAAQTLATVTTVSAVTAITNALPAGTNSIGSVKLPDVATFGALAAVSAAVTTAVNSQGIVAIQLTGTWVGTVTFQGTEDPLGATAPTGSWFNVNGVASVTGLQLTNVTTNGQFRVNSGGYTAVRAIMTAFTSGSATVWINASLAPSMATLAEPLPVGANLIGSVKLTDGTQILTPVGENNTFADTKIGTMIYGRTTGSGAAAIAKPFTIDASGNLVTVVNAALPAGTNLLGNVGITGTALVSQKAATSTSATLQAAAVATGNGTVISTDGMSATVFTVSGTYVGTITFEGTEDGTNYTSISTTQLGTTIIGTTTTTTGVFEASVAGLLNVRARLTWTSGTSVTVTAHAVPVNFATRNINANIVSAGTLALDSTQTNGTAQSKITDGTTIANNVAGDTGQNALTTVTARKEVSYSTAIVATVATTDVSNHRWVSVQLTSIGTSGVHTFQISNDNATWYPLVLSYPGNPTNTPISNSGGGLGIYHGPIAARYFRVNVTGISAGTASGVIEFFAAPQALVGTAVAGNSNVNINTISGLSAAIADATTNPSVPPISAYGQVFNGTTWDRLRSGPTTGSVLVSAPTATGAATPANAFYMGIRTGGGTLGALGSAATDGDNTSLDLGIRVANSLHNGTNYDRARGNTNTVTGDTGTKIASFAGATQINYNHDGASITVLCGAVSGTSPTLTAQIQWSPDAGTTWLNLGPASTAITLTGNTINMLIYPTNHSIAGATPTALTTGATTSVMLNTILPRTWRLNYVIGGTTPSFAITGVYINSVM